MSDLNDARREAYTKRDAAGRMAEAIEGRLQVARARGDQAAVERLEIEYEAKLLEIREAAQLATEIEEEMARRSAERASRPSRSAEQVAPAKPAKKKRWWQLG